jgi:phospholipid N-methyltransferase
MLSGKTKKQNINSFIKDYKVAAISSSSRYLVKTVLKELRGECKLIVEQGAGDGVLSRELLKKMSKDGKLILVEQNKEFLKILKKIKDSRIIIYEGLAQDFNYQEFTGGEKADYVISSIPFFYLTESERKLVSKKAYENLKTGGKFIIFHQYRLLMKEHIEKFFTKTKFKFVVMNVFPCFVIIGKK